MPFRTTMYIPVYLAYGLWHVARVHFLLSFAFVALYS